MRLNQYLARGAGLSRRSADHAIEDGRVTVNDQAVALGQQVGEHDVVKLDGAEVNLSDFRYILLNKPPGYVCSRRPQGDTPTVYELLPTELHNLKLVGRLDRDTSGIIMLSDDGDYAQEMTHPKFAKQKIYEVTLHTDITDEVVRRVEEGVNLEDGVSKFEILERGKNYLVIGLGEGRNRQIRRTFRALDYHINNLHRISFGPHKLEGLKPGQWREWHKQS